MEQNNDYKILAQKFGDILLDPDIYYRVYGTEKPRPYHLMKKITSMRLNGQKTSLGVRFSNSKSEYTFSRLILNAQKGEFVDHRNRNILDNTRQNLRIVTSSQNQLNRRPNKKTGFYGVDITKNNGYALCKSSIGYKYKQTQFYLKDTPENRIICAFARDKMVLQAGLEEYAPLNFPCWQFEPFRAILLEEDLRTHRERQGL